MKLAVQLYSLRHHMENGENFIDILRKVKALGFDGVYENVTEDSVCTAAYVGTNTYYAETYETPVSITANQAHTVTTSAMAPGIYQIRTARVFTGIAGGVTVSANGRSY